MPSERSPAACQLRLLFPSFKYTTHVHSAQTTGPQWLTPVTVPSSLPTTTASTHPRHRHHPPTKTTVQVRSSGCNTALLDHSAHLDLSCIRFQTTYLVRADQNLPRKREREVSLEPATPKTATSAVRPSSHPFPWHILDVNSYPTRPFHRFSDSHTSTPST